jgi:flagellar biosynthesis protein FlhF
MAAIKKFALYGSQQLVITKFDETARTGAAIGIASDSGLPLSYICAGQRVPGDIQRANSLTLASHVLRTTTLVAAAAA